MCEWKSARRRRKTRASILCNFGPEEVKKCRCISRRRSRTEGRGNYTWNNGKLSSGMYPMEKRKLPKSSDSAVTAKRVCCQWKETCHGWILGMKQFGRETSPSGSVCRLPIAFFSFSSTFQKKKKKNCLKFSHKLGMETVTRVNRHTAPLFGPNPALNFIPHPFSSWKQVRGLEGLRFN